MSNKLRTILFIIICGLVLGNPSYSNAAVNAPSNLTALAKSSTQIVISWKDKSSDERGFRIERMDGSCGSANTWTEVVSQKPKNSTSHPFSNLSPNTTYAFKIRAYNSSGISGYSNCAYAKTGPSGTPPAPSNLRAISVSTTKINLTWKDNSSNETGFEIYRKDGFGAWTKLTTTSASAVSYSDTSASNNQSSTSYQYYLKACNASGCSPASNTAIVPFRPIDVSASMGSESGTVSVSWKDKSSNETGFEIYRKNGSCSSSNAWAKAATVGANKTSWIDKNKTSGNTYAYKVRAYKKIGAILFLSGYGYSLWSKCDDVTLSGGSPPVPTNTPGYIELGRGTDVFGEYACEENVLGKVLDIDELNKDNCLTLNTNVGQFDYDKISGSTVSEYAQNLGLTVGLKGTYYWFSASIKTSFQDNSYRKSGWKYVTLSEKKYKSALKIINAKWFEEYLKDYLTDDAAKAINDTDPVKKWSPQDLFSAFGTHVMLGLYTGGRLDYNLSVETTETSHETLLYAEAKASGTFASSSFQLSATFTDEEKEKFEKMEQRENIRAKGGDSQYARPSIDSDYTKWKASLDKTQSFVGIIENATIGIWKLADDKERGKAIYDAFVEYAADQGSGFEPIPEDSIGENFQSNRAGWRLTGDREAGYVPVGEDSTKTSPNDYYCSKYGGCNESLVGDHEGGGFLFWRDRIPGYEYYIAPESFTMELSKDFYGGKLKFSLFHDRMCVSGSCSSGTFNKTDPIVKLISSNYGTLSCKKTTLSSVQAWQIVQINLDIYNENRWVLNNNFATEQEIKNVLDDHPKLEIRAEYWTTDDRGFLDNVLITKPPVTTLNGEYRLQQKWNQKYVDAYETSDKDYRLVTRESQDNYSQIWIITPVGGEQNTYLIQQKINQRYVEAYGTSDKDYALVTRLFKDDDDTQKWIITPAGGDADNYRIQHKVNSQYVDAYTKDNDYALITRLFQNDDTQIWIIK